MLIHLEAWSPMRHFPGSAFEVIDDVLGRVGEKMTYQDLIEGVARKTGVPSLLVNQGILDKVQTDMLNYLNQRVIGQPEPIKRLVAGIMAFAHGINRRDMPIISLMFPGPTGVGKTEVARALSEFLFGDHKRLLIINGEAYSAPPGSGDIEKLRNTIIEHIERYPFNIIVPDEFEKMHPDYQAVILSLGDGKMTDSLGRSVKSNLSIILTTTNIGSEKIRDLRRTIGFTTSPPSAAEVAETFHREAEKGFRPEVVGRFDGIIPFNPINREMGESIIKQYLVEGRDLPSGSIQHRLGLHNIHLEFDQSVYDFMLANYISFEFGARKLAKNIEQDFVQGFLTLQMNQGLKPGGRYKVSHDGKGYKLTGL
jgi:ATP-dependent Clp protease ATP-binding subunit ClpC